MNIKKILCPVDFSEFTDTASEFATIFACETGAEIVYLHIAKQGAFNGTYGYSIQRTADSAMAKLKKVKPTASGIKYSHDVKVCTLIANRIVEYAEEHHFDLIVIPTHGRTGIRSLLLGSVAEAVLRNASCAVATIQPGSRFFDQEPESNSPEDSLLTFEKKESLI